MANRNWKLRFSNGLTVYPPIKRLKKWILLAGYVVVMYVCFHSLSVLVSQTKPKFYVEHQERHSVSKVKTKSSQSHTSSSLLSSTRRQLLQIMVVTSRRELQPSTTSTLAVTVSTLSSKISTSKTTWGQSSTTTTVPVTSSERMNTENSTDAAVSFVKRKTSQPATNAISKLPTASPSVMNASDVTPTQERKPGFSLILPHVEPKLSDQERNLFVAVVVNTAAAGFRNLMLRETIRQTWGKSIVTIPKYAWKVFFSFGIPREEFDKEANLQEAQEKNDIIIGNFSDNYRNLPTKTFMSHYWAVTRLSCKYVLKTDDDVYVRVPRLIGWLVKSGSPGSFYGGYVSPFHQVPRDPTSKWYISPEQYNKSRWPPFCHGAFHVLSSDIIPRYLNYTRIRKPFHADDAYVGVASDELGIKATQIPGFHIEFNNPTKTRTVGEMIASLALGHKLDSQRMLQYYYFYKIYQKLYDIFLSPTDHPMS